MFYSSGNTQGLSFAGELSNLVLTEFCTIRNPRDGDVCYRKRTV